MAASIKKSERKDWSSLAQYFCLIWDFGERICYNLKVSPPKCCPTPHTAVELLQYYLWNLHVAARRDSQKSWNISEGCYTWAALGHSKRRPEHWKTPLTPAFITLYTGHSEKFILGGRAQEMTPLVGLPWVRITHEPCSAKCPKCYTCGTPVTSHPAPAANFIAL